MSIVYVPVKKIYGRTAGLTHTKSQVPPIPFNANDQGLISWTMLGNGQQTGTPSPDNIIMPDFCGVRTGNLFPLDATKLHVGRIENDGTIDYEVGTITVGTNSVTYQANATWRGFYTDYIQADENVTLTFSPNDSSSMSWSCICYDENDNFLGRATAQSTASIKTFTTLASTKKVRIAVTSSFTEYTITNPMLNTGSTALPYEPYGWVEKITCGGQTTPVYLGQVQTVRRIKKIVLTGEEMWQKYTSSLVETARFYLSGLTPGVSYTDTVSSHFQILSGNEDVPHLRLGTDAQSVYSVLYIFAPVSIATTSEQLKSYLAQQYAAGTPVTAWYVLATPETGIVNEPLCKINTYADELHSEDTTVTIPTANGANTISVDSTIPPSSLTIQYTSPDYSLITKVYDNHGAEIYST